MRRATVVEHLLSFLMSADTKLTFLDRPFLSSFQVVMIVQNPPTRKSPKCPSLLMWFPN